MTDGEGPADNQNAAACRAAMLGRFSDRVDEIHHLNGNEVHVLLKRKEDIPDLCLYARDELKSKLSTMFCSDDRGPCGAFTLRYVFARAGGQDFFIVLTARIRADQGLPGFPLDRSLSFPSIAFQFPSAALYEREIRDMFGLFPDGSPDKRPLVLHERWPEGIYPLRKEFDVTTKVDRTGGREYKFTKVEGEGVCEIPVGPVHAGIIEPGHFRFSVLGESIINLETRLFYVHRGVEKLGEKMNLDQVLLLSERIAGDEAVANSTAYCQALERAAGVTAPERALQTRVVCAEMERIYNHLGTLAGMSTDVGFAYGSARLNILKERMMQLNEQVTGSRLLFGTNRVGGVGVELDADKVRKVRSTLKRSLHDFELVISMLRNNSSVMDRLLNTGTIARRVAVELGLTGVAARCAGVDEDTRRDHPYAAYSSLRPDKHHDSPMHLTEHEVEMQMRRGDALARFEVRVEEVVDSAAMIDQAIENMPQSGDLVVSDLRERLEPHSHALGYAESHRGQTLHWVTIGDHPDSLSRYKVRTASFVNWPAIEQAVIKDIVPDFPLINKSLDLSYAGNDL
ncbi:MAG: NADH-quinone oxidoreductase subunit C [Nitrososphaerota archaeon]|nr:NADH-quinone oxidoreductase subunit C [Nitrososphaerota archaeon]